MNKNSLYESIWWFLETTKPLLPRGEKLSFSHTHTDVFLKAVDVNNSGPDRRHRWSHTSSFEGEKTNNGLFHQSIKISFSQLMCVVIYKMPQHFYDSGCTFSNRQNPDVCFFFFFKTPTNQLCSRELSLASSYRDAWERLRQQLNSASSQPYVYNKHFFLTGHTELQVCDSVYLYECKSSCCQSPRSGSGGVTCSCSSTPVQCHPFLAI